MKKNIFTLSLIALLIAAALTSCTPADNAVTTKNVRVIGTARKVDGATRALETTAEEKFVIDSVDKVMVNGKDIKNDLTPVGTVTDGQNNVTFEAEVTVPKKVTFTADAKPGYVFDEWEVLEVEEDEEEGKKAAQTADPALLDEIEDWLEIDGREHKETLTDVPAEYLTYLVAEYDNGFYVELGKTPRTNEDGTDIKGEGTKANPYSAAEFEAIEYAQDELTLVLLGTGDADFQTVMSKINLMKDLEELKLKAEGATLGEIPSFEKLEEIALSGFTFSNDVTINSDKMEYKFVDCNFENLTVTLAKEIEIKGGTAKVITVIAAEEVEIENLTATKVDLSQMESGEVELENVTADIVKPVSPKVEFEIETDEE